MVSMLSTTHNVMSKVVDSHTIMSRESQDPII